MKALHPRFAQRQFTAARDDYGVPHISAPSWLEALYGLGYMHALDRATQLLFARSIAAGRSAELIKDRPELAEADRLFRRVGLALRLDEEVRLLDDATFNQLTAYCEGVNDGLKDSGRTLPMWATGFRPSPWNQQAVLLIGNLLGYGGLAVGQQQNERLILDLIHAGIDEALLKELFSPLLDEADFELLRRVKISSQLSDQALELITDLPRLAGSNAWAVAPWRSATGHALLASDPHLEINRLPAIWYEAVLRWGDHYVLGATLPGCPLFAVARTERLAWGVTYMKGDTSDYFIEDCRRGGATGWQYRRGEAWRDFAVREETIAHKSGQRDSLRIYFNAQGTLESDPETAGEGLLLSTAWTGSDPGCGRAIATWLQMVAAPDVLTAMDVARQCPQPTLCWVLADREGHIGLQGCGWFPQRINGRHSGLLPIPAWDERNHWRGRLPERCSAANLRSARGLRRDGKRGTFKPARRSAVRSRCRFLRTANSELPSDSPRCPRPRSPTMQRLQYDVVSPQSAWLLEIFLPNLNDGPIKQRLTAWDCRLSSRQPRRHSDCFRGCIAMCCWKSSARRRIIMGQTMVAVTNLRRTAAASAGGGCCI